MWDFPLFPDRASTMAGRIDAIYFAWLGIAGLVALAVTVALIVFAVKYRQGSKADRSRGLDEEQRRINRRIEITWIVTPLAIFMVMFVWAADVYYDYAAPPPDALEVYVVGKQWMWKLQHPSGQREIDELHIPVGRPIKLVMTSEDVIHSFFVPAFRVKQDVLPGRYTTLWFQALKPGEYHLFCAEYCGTEHSRMRGRVIALAAADYERWLDHGTVPASMAARGAERFRQFGCSGCHGASSTVHAPKLEGVFGKPVQLRGGTSVIADERYIRDSILLPLKDVVAGYEPIMPSFQGQIGEDQLLEIIAYIKSIATDQGQTP